MSGYTEVKESDEFSSEDPFLTSPSRERRRWGFVFRFLLQATIVSSLCLASFFIGARNASRPNEVACVDTAWDKVREGISFKTHEFNPRFGGRPSPYMGHPNTGVDKLWYHLAALRNFGVPKEVLVPINRTRGAVKLPGNDGYMAGMEAFHQLHCLNYIRMYTYVDYYEKIDTDIKAETMGERREHADHCVETLRQRLMCNPDMNIYTYHWMDGYEMPAGNLFSRHRCIDWDRFDDWAGYNALHYPAPTSRPEGFEV